MFVYLSAICDLWRRDDRQDTSVSVSKTTAPFPTLGLPPDGRQTFPEQSTSRRSPFMWLYTEVRRCVFPELPPWSRSNPGTFDRLGSSNTQARHNDAQEPASRNAAVSVPSSLPRTTVMAGVRGRPASVYLRVSVNDIDDKREGTTIGTQGMNVDGGGKIGTYIFSCTRF